MLSFGAETLPSCLLSKNIKIKIYRTVIFPVVVYGCKTWSLKLREKRKVRVFENRALKRIFGSKRYELTGEWKRLHNGELYYLLILPNIIRVIKLTMKWAGNVALWGQERCIQGFGGEN